MDGLLREPTGHRTRPVWSDRSINTLITFTTCLKWRFNNIKNTKGTKTKNCTDETTIIVDYHFSYYCSTEVSGMTTLMWTPTHQVCLQAFKYNVREFYDSFKWCHLSQHRLGLKILTSGVEFTWTHLNLWADCWCNADFMVWQGKIMWRIKQMIHLVLLHRVGSFLIVSQTTLSKDNGRL